jgi:hypothetical protein
MQNGAGYPSHIATQTKVSIFKLCVDLESITSCILWAQNQT